MTTQALTPMDGFTFGCDPELFIFGPDGQPVSAEGLIPGSKEEPHKVEYGAVQRDGLAAEFNIDPVDNFRDWNRNIQAVMGQLEAMLPAGHTLQAVPSVRFSEEIFLASSKEALALGCSPDYNAWTQTVNPPPSLDHDPFLRCAGGHIHFGWTKDAALSDPQHMLNCCDLVKQLDWYLGGWSLKLDENTERRSLYGKAGACRIKDYGVEYRVLSNFWVTTRDRRLAVWNRMVQAIADMRNTYLPDRVSRYNSTLVDAINQSSVPASFSRAFRFPLTTLDHSYARY